MDERCTSLKSKKRCITITGRLVLMTLPTDDQGLGQERKNPQSGLRRSRFLFDRRKIDEFIARGGDATVERERDELNLSIRNFPQKSTRSAPQRRRGRVGKRPASYQADDVHTTIREGPS